MRSKFSRLRFNDKIFLAYGFVFLLMFGVMFGITHVLTRLAFKRQMETYVEERNARISNQYSSFIRTIKRDVVAKANEPNVRSAILRGETDGRHLGETDFDIMEYGTAYGKVLFSTGLTVPHPSVTLEKKGEGNDTTPTVRDTLNNPRANIRVRKVTQGEKTEPKIVIEVTESGDWGFFTGGYFFPNWLETEPIIQSDEHPIFLIMKNNRNSDWNPLNYAATRNALAFREQFLKQAKTPQQRRRAGENSRNPEIYPEPSTAREISLPGLANTSEEKGNGVFTAFQIEPFSSPYVDSRKDVEVELIIGYSHQRQIKWQQQLTSTLLLSGLGGLALVYLISYGMSRRITRPIAILREGVSQIASGNLNHRVDVHSQSEIGQLADGFNQMAHDLRHSLEERMAAERAETWRDVAQQVAHEIKNPLFPIRLSVENLQQAKAQPEIFENIFHECTETVIEEVDRIGKLIDEFQQFARMPIPKRKPVDLNRIVTSVLTLYKNAGRAAPSAASTLPSTMEEETNIKIESHLSPLPQLSLDKEQIAQVLGNLLKNAMEAMPDGGTLQVKTSVSHNNTIPNKKRNGIGDGGEKVFFSVLEDRERKPNPATGFSSSTIPAATNNQIEMPMVDAESFSTEHDASTRLPIEAHKVLLEVKDTGHGMSTDTLDNLFTPYFTTKSNGIGLGMAIVQRIVADHGGTIHVESDEEVGTTIQISFDVSASDTSDDIFLNTTKTAETVHRQHAKNELST